MSKIKATILLKNRKPKTITVNPNQDFFIYREGLYVISNRYVALNPKEEPTLFYHEGVPTALNHDQKQQGTLYMNDHVTKNLLIQLTNIGGGGGSIWDGLGDILKPERIPIIILMIIVAYAIIVSGGKL